MKNISTYRNWLFAFLFAITMIMPQSVWAATHYDAGYVSATATYSNGVTTITVDNVRLHNYQGNNSHWYGAPTVTLNVNGVAGTFTFANLVSYSDGNKNFYYTGEGNEDPYKSGFSSSKWTGTINDCAVSAEFTDKKYNQTITTQHWCTADLVITITTTGYVTASLSGTWRDYSDGVNKNESVNWAWGTFMHTHPFGSYSYNNNASYTVAGTKTRTCTYGTCGATETIADGDHPMWTYNVTSQNENYGTVSTSANNKQLTLTASPKTGYKFDYWQIGNEQISTNPYTYTGTGNMTAKAYFLPTATITFDANGGSGTMAQQVITASGALKVNTFTRENYFFAGWNTQADGSGTAYADAATFTATDSNKGPITLYAQWDYALITITFDANGGTGAMAAQEIISSGAITTNTFTRDGYQLVGWRTASDGGTFFLDESSFTVTTANKGPLTLYAWWAPESNTVWHYTATSKVEPETSANLKNASGQTLSFTNEFNNETKDGVYVFDGKLMEIGESAFVNCESFTGGLTIPNTVTSIGNEAFRDCTGFTGSLTIPNSVTNIGPAAFSGCLGFTGDLVIPNSVTSISKEAFMSCTGFKGSLIIPNSVTSIGNWAFMWCPFTGVEMKSIPNVGTEAFYNVNCGKSLVLDDNSYVYTGGSNSNFPGLASNPTYTRTMSAESQWGAVVLPFQAVSNDDVQLYQLTGIATMTLTPVASVEANTPCVFKKKNASATSVIFTAGSKNVSTNIPATPAASAVEGLTLTGAYASTQVTTGAGYVLDDAGCFARTTANTNVAPFGAYLKGSIEDLNSIVLHLEHLYNAQTDAADYLVTAATCAQDEVYYHKCSLCQAKGTSTWVKSGTALPHTLEHFICKDCGAEPESIESGVLGQYDEYKRTKGFTIGRLTFMYGFLNANWKTWYRPFEYTINNSCDYARINNVHQYEDENGNIDQTVVECFRLSAGATLKANYPYLFRNTAEGASHSGDCFYLQNVTMSPATESSIECESMDYTYTFTGNYTPKYKHNNDFDEVYNLSYNGNWELETYCIDPQTHYLTITPRADGYSSHQAAPARVLLQIIGEEDATGIVTLYTETKRQAETYTLSGQRLAPGAKGLQIRNGKTMFVK